MKFRSWNWLLACFVVLFTAEAYAVQEPKPGKADSRIRAVTYEPENVTRIYGYLGFATLVFFGEDEVIDENRSNIGLIEKWELIVNGNQLSVRLKKEPPADTNLLIVTSDGTKQRKYYFELRVNNSGIAVGQNPKGMMFAVRFVYPKDRPIGSDLLAKTSATPLRNYNYSFCVPSGEKNPKQWAPYDVYDNGTFTYLRFYHQQQVPAIFRVNPDGTESMIGRHTSIEKDGEVIVIEGVSPSFAFRWGKFVAHLIKEDPILMTPQDTSGTSVQGTELMRRR